VNGVYTGCVEYDHAAIIQRHCMYLVHNLTLDLDKLVQYDVISSVERQQVEVETSSHARNYLVTSSHRVTSSVAVCDVISSVERQQVEVETSSHARNYLVLKLLLVPQGWKAELA